MLRTSREVVNEATAPAKIRDSWEDVSTVAAPPLGKDILQKQPINGILSMTPRTYTKSELFELRLQRSTSPPPDLPSFLVGVSTAGELRVSEFSVALSSCDEASRQRIADRVESCRVIKDRSVSGALRNNIELVCSRNINNVYK